jgi:ribosomal protein L37AE/L43A
MTEFDTDEDGYETCPECDARLGFTTEADDTTIWICPGCLRTYGEVTPP